MSSIPLLLPAVIAMFLVVATPTAAQAEISVVEEDRTTQQAETHMVAGEFASAIPLYARLYAETRRPVYLRNLARCHQFLKHPDQALLNFRQYLVQATDLAPGERNEVQGFIEEMEQLKRQQQAPSMTPAPAVVATGATGDHPPTASTATPAVALPVAATKSDPQPARPLNPPRTLRLVGIGAVVVGAVGIGIGAYFSVQVARLEDRVQKAPVFNPMDDQDGKSALTWQYVGYGVGAALVLTGVTLAVLDGRAESNRVALAPSVGCGQMGAVVAGRF